MALLTDTEIYAHLRLDDSPPADAAIVDLYKEAAYDYVAKYLNTPDYPESYAIKAAALLVIGDLYENREAQGIDITIVENPAVMRLLTPYRQFIGI